MKKIETFKRISRNRFKQTIIRYQSIKCLACLLQAACNPGGDKWGIDVNCNLTRFEHQAEKRLKSKCTVEKRKQCCYDTEPAFTNIRHSITLKDLCSGLKKSGY